MVAFFGQFSSEMKIRPSSSRISLSLYNFPTARLKAALESPKTSLI